MYYVQYSTVQYLRVQYTVFYECAIELGIQLNVIFFWIICHQLKSSLVIHMIEKSYDQNNWSSYWCYRLESC